MIKKYKKKQVVIEAIKFDGSFRSFTKIKDWMCDNGFNYVSIIKEVSKVSKEVVNITICIPTLEGTMEANKGDYVIKGIKNEFYPCKPDIFEMSYEEVEE